MSADRTVCTGPSEEGQVSFGGLPEKICVYSRAETRESVAQKLEGGNEGARDRVVTELHLHVL